MSLGKDEFSVKVWWPEEALESVLCRKRVPEPLTSARNGEPTEIRLCPWNHMIRKVKDKSTYHTTITKPSPSSSSPPPPKLTESVPIATTQWNDYGTWSLHVHSTYWLKISTTLWFIRTCNWPKEMLFYRIQLRIPKCCSIQRMIT